MVGCGGHGFPSAASCDLTEEGVVPLLEEVGVVGGGRGERWEGLEFSLSLVISGDRPLSSL